MNTDLFFLFLSVLAAKFIPHPPSLTPLLALAYYGGIRAKQLNTWILAAVVVLLANVCADLALAQSYHYPVFGAWSWFTQLGLLGCLLFGRYGLSEPRPLLTAAHLSVGYWLITNLGTFITSGLYPFSVVGLWNCFIYALPFLPALYLATSFSLFLLTGIYPQLMMRFLCKQPSP